MLSNKWTFSLTSLVVLIAFGLMCAVPFASANDGDEAHVDKAGAKTKGTIGPHVDFGVTLSAAETVMDVSYRGDANANNIQIMRRDSDDGREHDDYPASGDIWCRRAPFRSGYSVDARP